MITAVKSFILEAPGVRTWFVLSKQFGKFSGKSTKGCYSQNGATTLSITSFSITTFSIMTCSIKGLFVTLSINDIQHKWQSALVPLCWVLRCIHRNAERRYAECHGAHKTSCDKLTIILRCLITKKLSQSVLITLELMPPFPNDDRTNFVSCFVNT